jgi:hypothetical protein
MKARALRQVVQLGLCRNFTALRESLALLAFPELERDLVTPRLPARPADADEGFFIGIALLERDMRMMEGYCTRILVNAA